MPVTDSMAGLVMAPRPLLYMLLLLLAAQQGDMYTVYEGEYAHEVLPGSVDDPRGMANLPFNVDSNRQADGVSSVSPFTTTAPSFPLYTNTKTYDTFGITTELELERRKEHASALAFNMNLQGIAGRTAGQAQREAAAYSRMVQIGSSNVSLPSLSFAVDSSKRWNPSTFPVQAKETYRLEVRPSQGHDTLFASPLD